jgi:Histidine kinase-, DNA gyrase B-, and HSP90-like ATPase
VGETRVDLQHLLEDLRDAYTGALEETILTEVIANALDSGATRVRLAASTADATLTVADDGRGMQRRELARYHDVASSTKSRGEGIGFAGVGIKLGLLASRDVVTETRRGATHVATRWHLASRHRAPWKWIPPPGMIDGRGTAVRLTLSNPLSPLLDGSYIEEAIRRHFEPLLDPAFEEVLRRHYPKGMTFEIDGRPVTPVLAKSRQRVTIPIRLGRRRTPSAVAVIERHDLALPDAYHGIAISTFGKVIKRGWDWLGLTPAAAARVSGLVEAPDLAASLTLSKNDFIRTGARGAAYLAYRKAIQEVVSRQLTAWGDAPDADTRPRTLRLERDLERVLEDLAGDFPLLRSLVEHRAGGQKRLPLPGRGAERAPGALFANLPAGPHDSARNGGAEAVPRGDETAVEGGAGQPGEAPPRTPASEPAANPPASPASEEGASPPEVPPPTQLPTPVGMSSTVPGRRRPARYGLALQFESRPDDLELGRLVESTIWINEAHPAYERAVASRSVGYHVALTVALALAPLAVDAASEHAFLTQFLAHWGGTRADGATKRAARRGAR